MTWKRVVLIPFLVLIVLLFFLSFFYYSFQNDDFVENEEKDSVEDIVTTMMGGLTLEEKIGQMLIVSCSSTSMDDSLQNLLSLKPGGFILFRDNLVRYSQVVSLIDDIKDSSRIPMIISIDQEGGRVQRLTSLPDYSVSQIPSMWDVGKTKDSKLAYDIGGVIAKELQVFGINMDFAPVLDVISNPDNKVIGDRGFGSDVSLVSEMGVSLANGLKDNGIIPVYKHFPGHGNTAIDSHYDLPVVTKTKEELYQSDLIPFQNAISNGADVIMIGHLAVPTLTHSNIPASLSYEVITKLLKEEMGYRGLVITDALNMQAISKNYSEEEVYQMAILSGVDLLLMPKNPKNAISIIQNLVSSGVIPLSRIDESVYKILSLKYHRTLESKLDPSSLDLKEHDNIIKRVG